VGFTSRARFGAKIKVSKDIQAAVRFAGYSAFGNEYIDAYWGTPAPYLSNVFAGNSTGGAQGLNNTPWTRLTLDTLVAQHLPTSTKLVFGSVYNTELDNFILQKVPNPNVAGKSMAKFSERIVPDRKIDEVATLRYYEDEETYLPFNGCQLGGKSRFLTDFQWEILSCKLPFGANPTAGPGQPQVNDITTPYIYAYNVTIPITDKGNVKLNYLRTRDYVNAGYFPNIVPNHGNYWYWTDPSGYIGLSPEQMPMRGNAYISQQSQISYGASINYRFEPSYIRTLVAYAGSSYKPNILSSYSVKGNHFRAGVGWTNQTNNFRLDLEYLITDPYYDPYQLYFQPFGQLLLGGVPPGTPIAFAVVPLYYGGFPGSYIPFGYQLHDSGLYPNNRNGVRFSTQFRFPKNKGKIDVRAAYLIQNKATIPQANITGIIGGMQPGFIDPVFHPLRTDGITVLETPKGKQSQIGGGIAYKFTPKLDSSIQYDYFAFMRDTAFAPATQTAKRDYVNLKYNVFKFGLDYNLNKQLSLRGGYNLITVKGYHPVIGTLLAANAGTNTLDISQSSPYVGFDYDITSNVQWSADFRYLNNRDHLIDPVSPESFRGPQLTTQFNVKF
jgi:hypothetical protein